MLEQNNTADLDDEKSQVSHVEVNYFFLRKQRWLLLNKSNYYFV
jgi:hypothetical protein